MFDLLFMQECLFASKSSDFLELRPNNFLSSIFSNEIQQLIDFSILYLDTKAISIDISGNFPRYKINGA